MKAELIAVGTELLMGQISNTNAQYLSIKLAEIGIPVYHHTVVGDNFIRAQEVLAIAKNRGANVMLLTGGLGPTDDDITRDVVASFINKEQHQSQEIVEHIRGCFTSSGREMPDNNKKQAMVIDGAILLPNPRGTAPGMYVESEDVHFFLLPGPPTEMKGMYEEQVLPILKRLQGENKQVFTSRILRTFGIGESTMEERIQDIIEQQTNPTIAPYASEAEAVLRITASAPTEEEGLKLIDPVEKKIKARLEGYIYGINEETLPVKVGQLLQQAGQTLSLAESCTGGLVGSMLTDVSGSSSYFLGSIVSYHNDVKQRVLGVSEEIITEHGAVSSECAREMAEGAKKSTGSDWSISITGIAGPGGGTAEKPVGLVYIGVSGPNGTTVVERRLRGDRTQIRLRAAKNALYELVKRLSPKS
ncbi:MAG: competence/damage-inducible protein A [Bacilli bacterium]